MNIDWNNLGFKYSDTASHIEHFWRGGAWDDGRLVAEPWMRMHIAASSLHYGQAAFEGMKAFRCRDGAVRVFRPMENAHRMRRTAARACMPPVPPELFMDAVRRVVRANLDYVPPYGTGGSLYIRPLLIGTGPQIGVAPADEYAFIILVIPAGEYYKGGVKPVRSVIIDEFDRAAPLGMGDVKVAGNYAASLFAHEKAKRAGFPVELYLDAKTHSFVEEFATSNFIGVTPGGAFVTPDSPSVLPSVTNDTLQRLAADMGLCVEKRPVPYEELPEFSEIAACGTAVVVTPVYEITRGERVMEISDPASCPPAIQRLYDAVRAIQYGEAPDPCGWCVEV